MGLIKFSKENSQSNGAAGACRDGDAGRRPNKREPTKAELSVLASAAGLGGFADVAKECGTGLWTAPAAKARSFRGGGPRPQAAEGERL